MKRYRRFENVSMRGESDLVWFRYLRVRVWLGRWLEICRGIFYPLFGYLLGISEIEAYAQKNYTIISFYIDSFKHKRC